MSSPEGNFKDDTVFCERKKRNTIAEIKGQRSCLDNLSAAPKGATRSRRSETPKCILLIDDDPVVVRMCHRMLERNGYSVVSLTDPREAVACFDKDPRRFDLVITDQAMPDMSGAVLTRYLTRVRPDIPLIVCTGAGGSMTPEQHEALSPAIRSFIPKPFIPMDFVNTVEQVLDD